MIERSPEALRALSARIFEAAGTPADIAAQVADHLVLANVSGHDSHGVIRVAWYVKQIQDGSLRPGARPTVLKEVPAAVLVSGEWGFGHPAATLAMDSAIERAIAMGLGAAGLIRATHLGRLGTYTERAAERGTVAMMWLGGLGTWSPSVPFGGSSPVYGTNPISAAFPAGESGTVLLDYATTAIAGGKVWVARDAGAQLPPDSIVDKHGRPSTEPKDFFEGGALVPFGRHKGYALAFLAQLLGRALVGADQTGDEGGGGPTFSRSGAFFIAVDAGLFRSREEVVKAASTCVEEVRAVPPAPGFESVLAPGDPEAAARRARRDAIPLAEETWRTLVECAASVGVAVP